MKILKYSIVFSFIAIFAISCSETKSKNANNEIQLKNTTYSEDNSIPVDTANVFEGWTVWDVVTGDLNNDKYEDVIFVLRKSGKDVPIFETTYKRRVLLYTRNARRYLTLEAVNDNLIIPMGYGQGDTFDKIVIKDGYFSTEHFGAGNNGWLSIVTFKYNAEKKDWFLHKITNAFGHSINQNPDGSYDMSAPSTEVKNESNFKDISIRDFDFLKYGNYTN